MAKERISLEIKDISLYEYLKLALYTFNMNKVYKGKIYKKGAERAYIHTGEVFAQKRPKGEGARLSSLISDGCFLSAPLRIIEGAVGTSKVRPRLRLYQPLQAAFLPSGKGGAA